MQILYWHLTRPQASTYGGSVSPPLLQRRDNSIATSSNTYSVNNSHVLRSPLNYNHPLSPSHHNYNRLALLGEDEDNNIMDLDDDSLPTFFLLNADEIDEDDTINDDMDVDSDVNGHGSHSSFAAFGSDDNNPGDGDHNRPPGGHYNENGGDGDKPKKEKEEEENENDESNSEDDENSSDDENDKYGNRSMAKLIINLYQESRGYTFACSIPGLGECQESHLIPYSEKYLLDSIDNEVIPMKLVSKLEEREGITLMRYRNHVLAEVRDFRRFSTGAASLASGTNLAGSPQNASNSPVIRQVCLRPTNQSLLSDFDILIQKSYADRRGWKRLRELKMETENSSSENEVTTGDSDIENEDFGEYELEVDLPTSMDWTSDHLSFDERLELEKRLVNETAESLCLDPSPMVGVIANRIQFERLKWNSEQVKSSVKNWQVVREVEQESEEEEETFGEARNNFVPFYKFVLNVKARSLSSVSLTGGAEKEKQDEKDRLKLLAIPVLEYPPLLPPTHLEEILKLAQTPEPAAIRALPIDNFVKKIEEYTLETERRKRPHTTKLSIFQRNGVECYFGELEMESFVDPGPPKPGKQSEPAAPSTKCQFELGSSRSVALYVKQFSDIFTEDGRRPCKITYQKVGQVIPQVVYTSSYKTPTPNQLHNNAVSSVVSSASVANAIANSHQQNQTASSSASSASTSSASQPPVQIVHPQPRPAQHQIHPIVAAVATPAAVQIYTSAANTNQINAVHTVNHNATPTVPGANVNFNLNVNSAGIVGISPQQVLTRPHIFNVNLQQQPQQLQHRPVQIQAAATQQQIQQLAQQRTLRMKQQQQQQPTALAKLLLTNLHPQSGTKPITVAVQPQPQNPNNLITNSTGSSVSSNNNISMSITSPLDQHHLQNSMGSPIMIASPPTATASGSSNVSVNVNTTPNVSVNLNTISLDGLIAVSSANVNYGPATTNNLVTSNMNVGINRLTTGNSITPATALNILRLNAAAGGNAGGGGNLNILNASNLQRQLTMSNVNASNVSIMSPPQRILINSTGNSISTVNTNSVGNSNQVTELEEISVPDLNTLLNSQQIQLSQLGVGQHLTLGQQIANSQHHHHQQQQQQQSQNLQATSNTTQTLDGHNLNLNLNLNLNSGETQQHQIAKIHTGEWTTTQQAPPFLVFISPLPSRPLVTTAARQSTQTSTLNLNLSQVQAAAQAQAQAQDAPTIVFETTTSNHTMSNNSNNNNNNNNSNTQQQGDSQNLLTSSEVVGVSSDGVVDSLFNALSEAIGPELGQKLDGISGVMGGGNTAGPSSSTAAVSSCPTVSIVTSSMSPSSSSSVTKVGLVGIGPSSSHSQNQNTSIITLNDLLGSPTMVSSSTSFPSNASIVLNSNINNNSGSLLSPITISSSSGGGGTSSLVSSTPRLSALLAGSPSADSIMSPNSNSNHSGGILNNSINSNSVDSSTSSSSSYGNLLDRLAASLSQPQGAGGQVRTGTSRLNPIATATPNVVLEHPMLAASLTQQTTQRATAYRQIAPAPPPNMTASGLVSHAHAQPQQLINLLGLVGNSGTNAAGQRTIRISANPATATVTGNPSPGSAGNMGSR